MLRISRWLAVALLVPVLVACGGSDSPKQQADTPDAVVADNAAVEETVEDTVAPDNAVAEVPPAEVEEDAVLAEVPPAEVEEDAVLAEVPPAEVIEETTVADLPPAEVDEDVPATETTVGDEGGETTLPATEFEILIQYLEGEGGNYINAAATPKVVDATDVMATFDEWKVIDVRAEDKYGYDANGIWQKGANGVADFDEGHIVGAVHVALKDVLDYAAENFVEGDKILVVCHTGQAASYAVAALNLLGYDAWSLKWGMSSWNARFDLWSGIVSSTYDDAFVTTADEGLGEAGDYPTLDTGLTDPAAILKARLAAVLAAPRFVTVSDLMAAPEDFYIINYWPEAEYLDPGHVAGAHQYTPKTSLLSTAVLNTLPKDQKIAVYCYSGQHSGQVAAFLNVLGYEAYSVKFGTNAMIYDKMPKQKWPGPAGAKDYVFDPPQPAINEFMALASWLEGVGGNYVNTTAPKVVAAQDLWPEEIKNYVVLDIRADDKYGKDGAGEWKMAANGKKDYDDGHIAGAIFVELKDIVTYALANLDKSQKILVVCHTGQNAGHAVLALNLLGYDAYSLKWGMSGWHKDFDLWSTFTASTYVDQFVKDADPGKNAAGDYPVLATGETTVDGILQKRIADVLAAPRIIKSSDVLQDKDSFYIVNYWPEEDYLAMGHVSGSHQYSQKSSLQMTALLNTLPTDKKVAVYCYSGQVSSQIAAYLSILGYDAWSMKFGTNAMIYDTMTKQKWAGPESGPQGYAYEATPD